MASVARDRREAVLTVIAAVVGHCHTLLCLDLDTHLSAAGILVADSLKQVAPIQ